MNKTFIFAGLGAVTLVAAGTIAYFYGSAVGSEADTQETAQQNGPPPAVVTVAEAEERRLAPHAETPGSVVSIRDSLVAAATSGKIEWVAEVGAEVEEGETIARIEAADAQLAFNDSAAEVSRMQSRADFLSTRFERFNGLGDEAGESETALDQMRADRDEALQGLRQAEVAKDRAALNLQRTEVKAPFAGRVVSQESQIGEFATPGAGLVRLVDTRRLEVTARAPASLARNISAGDIIRVSNGPQQKNAQVRAVVPVGDALSRMLELRLELEDTDWYIGSAVRVALPTMEARQVTAAPRDALVLRADRISIFVIDEEETARRVDVELGAAEGDFIEVLGDIKPGDSLVIRGGERLRDGQKVTLSAALETVAGV
ncbi:MAG: efflux RND transporter periplasmic adaptor subunit [Pseudomonadota bacterium]